MGRLTASFDYVPIDRDSAQDVSMFLFDCAASQKTCHTLSPAFGGVNGACTERSEVSKGVLSRPGEYPISNTEY